MKTTITILLLLISCFSSFAQLPVDYKFYDSCQDKIIETEYQLMNVITGEVYSSKDSNPIVLPDTGIYLLDFGLQRGDFVAHYGENVKLWDVKAYTDTISVPRLILGSDGALHSKFNGFIFCSSIANGEQVDTYQNGKIRIAGVFKDAWPVGSLNHYDKTGRLIKKEYYKKKGLAKTEYFDAEGRLVEKEYFKNGQLITIYFDAQGKRIKK